MRKLIHIVAMTALVFMAEKGTTSAEEAPAGERAIDITNDYYVRRLNGPLIILRLGPRETIRHI